MDTTILKLLFSYKGAITSREFRIGIALVFMSMGVYIGTFTDTTLANVIAGREGTSWLTSLILYNQVANFFVPDLVPVLFVISYSSIILAVKRIRMLTSNRALMVFSGVLSYFFFASFLALAMLVAQTDAGSEMRSGAADLLFPLCVIFLAGVVNLVYLCIRRASEPVVPCCSAGGLNVFDYGIKLGNLMWGAAIVCIVIGIAFGCLGPMLLFSPIVPYGSAGCAVVILFFYIKYSVYRLKDANVSVLWLVGIIIVYLILLGIKVCLNLYLQNYLTLYYNTVFSIVNSFFVLAQYVLFLLPSKAVNPVAIEESNNK